MLVTSSYWLQKQEERLLQQSWPSQTQSAYYYVTTICRFASLKNTKANNASSPLKQKSRSVTPPVSIVWSLHLQECDSFCYNLGWGYELRIKVDTLWLSGRCVGGLTSDIKLWMMINCSFMKGNGLRHQSTWIINHVRFLIVSCWLQIISLDMNHGAFIKVLTCLLF